MSTNDNLIKVFEYALNQENTGLSFFQNSLKRMGVGAAVSAFEKLIEEERKHIEFITNILESLKTGEEIQTIEPQGVDLHPTDFFDARAESEFLQQCIDGSMVPDVTVFNTAWLIEKDLSEFYEKMAEQVTGKAKEALSMLAKWEKSHEQFFRAYRDKLHETYANMPWGG